MFTALDRLKQFHRFLGYQALYPMALSSLLAISLFAGRVYLMLRWDAGRPASLEGSAPSIGQALIFGFLVWNLFLAWIPYLGSLWAAYLRGRYPRRWWYLLVPGALWLAFFPNAPYIVTDLLHLQERAPIPFWYDVGMLMVFAWTGLFLAVFSLRTMHRLVKSLLGGLAGWLFVLASLGLGGLGVYIGRFLRWNSWDLLLHPRGVLGDVAVRLANPWDYPGTLGVTFLFAAFLLVCYLTLAGMPWPDYSAARGSDYKV